MKALLYAITFLIFAMIIGCSDKGDTSLKDIKIIPKEILFGNPEKAGLKISPDGKYLSFIAPDENVLNIWVQKRGETESRVITKDRNRGIRSYFWSEDSKQIIYTQDKEGDENWRLYAVDVQSEKLKDLTPFDDVQARVLDIHPDHSEEALVALNKENPQLHDVYHLNITTGELKMLHQNPGYFQSWFTDMDFQVRGGVSLDEEGGTHVHLMGEEKDSYVEIESCGLEDTLSPALFSKDGKTLYFYDSRGANATQLVAYDVATKEKKVVVSDDQYDIGGLMIHPTSYHLQATFVTRQKSEWIILDDAIKEDIQFLQKQDEGELVITSRDRADTIWGIAYNNDKNSANYYLYERATKKLTFLFTQRPELEDYELADMMPVSFEARDGLTIEGYLTFPPNSNRKKLPLVLNVHGGPWVRDTWGYDPEAQWFANRGYICFQVNYRGSSGYGKDFLNAGNKEWAGKMHDDLIDAVNFAIEKGYADKNRVAIFGGSYGGYAALVGATFTPDVFACAVDIVGPSSLITLIETIPPYWKPLVSIFHKRVGNPETEREFLLSRSPLTKVDQIKIPLLIAQGANDPRVKQSEAEQIVAALEEKGIDHQYVLFEDEGHGFAKPENRLKFYGIAEEFLAKHLGGRVEV